MPALSLEVLCGQVVCRHGSFLAPRLIQALAGDYLSESLSANQLASLPESGVVRFSLVHYNDDADVDRAIALLTNIGF